MTDPTPPQQPHYPPPPYYPQPPINMYAILSLVLAIFVLPPLGIYFGHKAKQQIAVTGERGTELATAGIVVGWIFTGFFILWCAFAVALIGGTFVSSVNV